jgi:SAM-dependent methyltransferase
VASPPTQGPSVVLCTAMSTDRTGKHLIQQKASIDNFFASHRRDPDLPLLKYIATWRMATAISRLLGESRGRINTSSRVLVLCAADGYEGSTLCDLGFKDVTISDLSDVALTAALERDRRLKTICLDAENVGFPDEAFDVVVTQDGLHHLQSPVRGFTEMLRVCKQAAFFLEPHDSWIGHILGKRWEVEGEAKNYVFRWNRKLVQDVASSYLVSDSFRNLSFSFWHHNPVFERIGRTLSMGQFGCNSIAATKFMLDVIFGRWGNQFCGMIILDRD